MHGCILINAFYREQEYLYQAHRLREEFGKLGVRAELLTNDGFPVTVGEKIRSELTEYDFCVFWDKDKYLLHALGKLGVRTFNRPDAILACDDKMTTYLELAGNGIPLPATLPGPLCFREEAEIPLYNVERAERLLGYPVIVKESYGSQGKGVYRANDRAELIAALDALKCKPYLLQQAIVSSFGKDLRVIVVGNAVLGGMLRRSETDFRSSVGAGGHGTPYAVPDDVRKLSLKIAALLKLDYCGIDFLFREDGSPVVCEVNSNAFFHAFERATGINVAQKYAEHILSRLR